MGLNKVFLRGRLGADPETRFTNNGKQVSQFNLAVDNGYGENKTTDWHRIQLWGKQAENAVEWLNKGDDVLIEGRLAVNKWINDKGEKQTMVYVIASYFERCGGRKDSNREPNGGWPEGSSKDGPQGGDGPPDEAPAFGDTDEIPF